jgi:phytoene/squalene synthetase
MELYDKTCLGSSKLFTKEYSTSFSKAVGMLDVSLRDAIYAIYGFVRIADEIVDTFHDHPKQEMLSEFRLQTFRAIEEKISTNPILHSFQLVANQYNIPQELITSFLDSMEMDLHKQDYSLEEYKKYIYGSAEVVGLMCLKVFCNGNEPLYNDLKKPAQSLGEAFQKVNFLRDLSDDYIERGRVYFPGVDFEHFTDSEKKLIENDIARDIRNSMVGIRNLPQEAKLGVYVASLYFRSLLIRIKSVKANDIINKRIRVPDYVKFFIMIRARLSVALGIV